MAIIEKLTLPIWERICDTFYDKCLEYSNLLGAVDKRTCEEYLAFYGLNGGLFWCEEDGKITGVGTVHPERKDFEWNWGQICGAWTVHCVWAETSQAVWKMFSAFMQRHQPVQIYACRRRKLVELTSKKLRKIFTYGRRRNNYSSTSSTQLRAVDAGDAASTN